MTSRLDRVTRRIEAATRGAAGMPTSDERGIPHARVPGPTHPKGSPMKTVPVALCQLAVGADKEANIARARRAICDAAADGAKLVVLPEMWNCPYANESFPVYAEPIGEVARWGGACSDDEKAREKKAKRVGRGWFGFGGGKKAKASEGGDEEAASAAAVSSPSVAMMAAAARECRVVLVGGSIPERCEASGRLYSTCCVFDACGTMLATHRKTHLFDIDIPGQIAFKESDTLTAGDSLTVVDTAVGRIGVGICFDIRFPEMAMVCANRGAQILVYPGAFNTVTGPLHWELLARARAVDNQCFVLVASPARVPGASYQAWGHSTAVGPWAEIIATCDEGPATVTCELDMEQVAIRRRNIPLEQQRRGDLYALHDLR